MRKASTATVALIVAIALYFTLSWGLEGLRALTSPNYGLEDVWHAQLVFDIGRLFGLAPIGVIKLAAFVAAMKLAIAAICGAHIVDRFRPFAGGQADPQILEGALIVVVVFGFLSVAPAVWSSNAEIVREYAIQILLACLALALCIAERNVLAMPIVEPEAESESAPAAPLRAPTAQLKQDAKLVMLLRNAVAAAADDEGWARVGAVGNQIGNQASFDPRNYGYATLTKLLAATQLFDMADEGKSSVMVRDKRLAKGGRH